MKAHDGPQRGTVAAVGFTNLPMTLIYQNAGSAPKPPTKVGAPTSTMQAPLAAAALDQRLAATGPSNPPLAFAGHGVRAHKRANGSLEVSPWDIGLWDPA
jgi:hypothetical protein